MYIQKLRIVECLGIKYLVITEDEVNVGRK